jgi:hypothetical protein
MSYDGSTYIALHDDLVEPDQPLDSFVEMALRNNQIYIDEHGHQISWTPRCWDADNMVAYTGHRPYASVAESTIMYIPWIVQEGLSDFQIQMEHRVSNEHTPSVDFVNAVNFRMELDGLRGGGAISSTTGSSYTWQPRPQTLLSFTTRRDTRIAPFTIWQKGLADEDTDIDTDSVVSTFSLGGRLLINTNALFDKASGTLPSASDQHVQIFKGEDTGTIADLLDTRDLGGGTSYAIARPQASFSEFEGNGTLHPLGYIQVRSIQISESFDRTGDTPDASRFLPQRTAEGRDEVSHALSQSITASRWRPLFVGPVGERQGAEVYPTGYGRKFETLAGSASAQPFFTCPINPRYPAPTIRLLAYVIGVWSGSGHEVSILSPEQLREATGQAEWTLTASVRRYEDGSATPVSLGAKTLTQVVDVAPSALTPTSPFLTQEAVIDGASLGMGSLPASWPYKEGQLFEEDIGLVDLIDISLDLSTYDPSTLDVPLIFSLTGTCSTTGFDYPAPPGGAIPSVGAGDLRLVCVGYTIWEKP